MSNIVAEFSSVSVRSRDSDNLPRIVQDALHIPAKETPYDLHNFKHSEHRKPTDRERNILTRVLTSQFTVSGTRGISLAVTLAYYYLNKNTRGTLSDFIGIRKIRSGDRYPKYPRYATSLRRVSRFVPEFPPVITRKDFTRVARPCRVRVPDTTIE